eukprot:3479825-Rhodomonas_salina.1
MPTVTLALVIGTSASHVLVQSGYLRCEHGPRLRLPSEPASHALRRTVPRCTRLLSQHAARSELQTAAATDLKPSQTDGRSYIHPSLRSSFSFSPTKHSIPIPTPSQTHAGDSQPSHLPTPPHRGTADPTVQLALLSPFPSHLTPRAPIH